MIRKTVYFRTQDELDKFNAIGNKAEWLSFMLSEPRVTKEWDNYWYANDPSRVKYAAGEPTFNGISLNTPEGKQAEKEYWETHELTTKLVEPTITPAEDVA